MPKILGVFYLNIKKSKKNSRKCYKNGEVEEKIKKNKKIFKKVLTLNI